LRERDGYFGRTWRLQHRAGAAPAYRRECNPEEADFGMRLSIT